VANIKKIIRFNDKYFLILLFLLLTGATLIGQLRESSPNVDSYGGLASAISTLGATEKTVTINTVQTLTENLTIPSNITTRIIGAGRIGGAFTLTHNGGFIAAPNQHCFLSDLTVDLSSAKIDVAYVNWFGSNTTPGTTDTTVFFNAALDSNAPLVKLLGQTYLVKRQGAETPILGVNSNQTVEGVGYDSVIKYHSDVDATNNWFMIGIYDSTTATAYENVTLRHLRLDGSTTLPAYDIAHEQCHGVAFYSASGTITNINIDDLYIHHFSGDAVWMATNTQDVEIKNVKFRDYYRHGINVTSSNNAKVHHNTHLTGTLTPEGSSFHTEPPATRYNYNISDNYFTHSILISDVVGLVIDNNILAGETIYLTDTGDTIVSNNTITTDSGAIYSIQIRAVNAVSVVGNQMTSDTGGIYVYIPAASSAEDNVIINNNSIVNTTAGYGIQILNINKYTANNNDVSQSFALPAIYASTSSDGNIVGNNVTQTGASYGIYAYAPNSSIHYRTPVNLTGNTIDSGTQEGIRVAGLRPIFSGNTILSTNANKINPTVGGTQHYPSYDGYSGVIYLFGSTAPAYGIYARGDRIYYSIVSAGGTEGLIVTAAGGLSIEVWNGGSTYYKGDFVTGSDSKIYEAHTNGGEAEDPTTDGDNTYWYERAASAATTKALGVIAP
jgi:hypothetical protein